MKKQKVEDVAEPTVGRETLEETPQRALKFLRSAGTSLAIRATLAAKGYTPADHREGWSLLLAASGYTEGEAFVDADVDVDVRDAIRAIDAWEKDGFRIVHASLQRRFPAVSATVLNGIGPSARPAAVVGVRALLERLDALEKGKNKDEHAALALLATRGLDRNERARLRALTDRAQSVTGSGATSASAATAARKAAHDAHVSSLGALRAWYEEWSVIARTCVKRRDHLIQMGLAKRKAPKRGDAAGTEPAGVTAGNGAGAATD